MNIVKEMSALAFVCSTALLDGTRWRPKTPALPQPGVPWSTLQQKDGMSMTLHNSTVGIEHIAGQARTMMSTDQKMTKITVGNSKDVASVLRFHFFPLKNLYIVADQYPAKDPIST